MLREMAYRPSPYTQHLDEDVLLVSWLTINNSRSVQESGNETASVMGAGGVIAALP